MKTIVLVSPYWHEPHRWMQSSVRLAELWQRIGYRVVVACLGSEAGTERVSDTLTIHRLRDHFFPDPWNYGIAIGFSRFVQHIVDRESADVVVVNKVLFWTSFALIPLARRGIPTVLLTDVLAGVNWMPRPWITRIVARMAGRTLQPFLLRRANHVVLSHPAPDHALRNLGIAHRTTVIPTGLDPAAYPRATPGKRLVVTYVGRVESNKGVDDLLAAAAPLAARNSSITIRVVGPYRPGHPLVKEYGDRVEFTGYQADVRPWLRDTSIFVLPSRGEGLSNALMEAMATGCACVVSDAGGNPWLVEDGVSGLVFPGGDRAALANRLEQLLGDSALRERLGSEARRRIEEEFSWETLGEKWETLFAEMGHATPRVAILSPFDGTHHYGAETMARELATRLAGRFDVTIVAARLKRSFAPHDTLPSGVHVNRIGLGTWLDKWLYPLLAALAIRKLRPDIAHATLESFAGLALALTRLTWPAAHRVQTLGTMSRHVLRGPITRAAHVVTAVSRAMRDLALRHGRADAIVIPNGVDVERIRRVAASTKRIPGRVVYVGRLVDIKGVDTFLRAFALLCERLRTARPPVRPTARVVGAGHQFVELLHLASRLGVSDRVTFTGHQAPDDVALELAAATVCAGLSRREAFGMALLEAQAAGCAVVASNVGGIRDFVEDGATGLLVPPGDAEAAAQALERLFTDDALREQLSANGRESAARYDWEEITGRFADVYERGGVGTDEGGLARPPHVLLATGNYPPDIGGHATILPLLARRMKERGWRVTVIAFSPPPGVDTALADLDSTWETVRVSRSGGPIVRWVRFARALRRHGPDAGAILAFSLVSVGIPLRLARLRGAATAVRMGGDFFWERYTDWGGTMDLAAWTASRHWSRRLTNAITEWLFRGFDRVSYTTEYQRSIHAPHYRSLGVHDVLESAPPAFSAPPKHRAGPGPFRLLWIGRMVAFKNLGSLIRAVASNPDLRLTLAGHGPEAAALQRLASQSGADDRITFLPAVDQVEKRALYHAHDLFVVPSHSDISPRAALEARAAGLPVLLTHQTGLTGSLVDGMILRRLTSAADIVHAIQEIRATYDSHATAAATPPPGGTLEDEADGLCDLVASLAGPPARVTEAARAAV